MRRERHANTVGDDGEGGVEDVARGEKIICLNLDLISTMRGMLGESGW